MGKTLGYGEITVANMTEPFTVMLTNEAQQFATDSNRKVTSAQSYYTDIIVIRGSQERTDYTIGNITSGSGITVSKSSKRVTFSVSAGTTIGADAGVIEIPITLDGQTVKKQFSWSCGKQGPQGVKGNDGNSFAWNMLSETNCGKKHWGTESSGGKYSVEDFITEDNIDAVKLICTEAISTSNWSYVSFKDIKMLKQLKPSTKYTLSYDIKANRSGAISHSICKGDVSNFCTNTVVVNNIIGNETWQHISVVLTTNDLKTTPTNEILYLGRNALSKVGYSIIKNLKLVEGDIDTPWSPSQSDIEGKGVVETVQYYLATSQASGVTSSTSGWSTDITTQKLTADKKYLWNCYQTKYSDGTSEPISTPKVIGVYGDKGQKGDTGEDGAGFHWNLLSGTKDLDKSKITFYSKATIEPTKYLDFTVVKATVLASSYSDILKWHDVLTPTPNTTYTLSFYAKASVETYCRSHFYPSCTVKNISNYETTTASDGGVRTKLSTEWNRYSVTWTTSSSVSGAKSIVPIRLEHGNTADGATVYLCGIKLEQSDKPSPWCTTYEETLAKNLSITPSSQYFKSTDGGKTFAPNTITIKPTIQGEISFGKWQYSIDGGVSFADVVSGQKGLTISNNVLTVSKDSSLYSDAVTMVTFRAVASDSSFYDTCSIAKIYDVSDIGDGRNLIQKSQLNPIDGAELSLDDYTKNGTVIFTNKSKNSGFSFDSYNNYQPNSKYVLSYYFTKTSGTMNSFGGFHNGKGVTYTSFFVDDKVYGTASYPGGSSQIGTILNDGKRHRIVVCYTTPDTIATDTSVNYTFIQPGRGNTNPNFGVKIEELKLEKGSSPTGWSPAPEDVQTAILSTKSEISDVSLKVDNNKQAIEQRVEKTTYERELTLVKGDISKANEGLNKWRYEIYPKSLFASEYQGKSTMDVFAKNTNLTPSQSVLINDTDLSIAWNYDNNYIGYALTFVKFSAAKSVAITFAHDDGAHIYLNGKLIGGNDVYNNKGESLTLGFVKGWNCIEVVVNEGASTEGFKLGTTLSALSECQLMNCYYGTPVARQSHITNQLVQNTTDIDGVSTKVSKVTSVIGDNGENFTSFKNDYSDFKQTMNGFKTTVGQTYVTKDDFNGLEIGGVNLFVKSTASRGWWISDTGVLNANGGWGYSDYIDVSGMKNYIASGFTNLGISPATCFYDSNKTFISGVESKNQNSQDSKRKTLPIPSNAKYMRFSFALADINTLKIEQGTKATVYSPSPYDDEINGQNLVSNLPTNWEQGTVTEGSAIGTTYANTKSASAGSIRPKELIPVSGYITISTAYSNQSQKPIRHWIAAYDVNKNYLGVNYVSNSWNSFPRTLDMKDAKYLAIMVGYTDSSAITPSDISKICLKIERGTSATPFTLAPEDINGKIQSVETIATQTADKFSWLVKSGTSSSNFELTDKTATLVASKINQYGLVTFNGLDDTTKDKINTTTGGNLITVTPANPKSDYGGGQTYNVTADDKGGRCVQWNSSCASFLLLNSYTPVNFTSSDQLYYDIRVPNWSSTTFDTKLTIWFYNKNKANITSASKTLTLKSTIWNHFTGYLTLPSSSNWGDLYYYIIGLTNPNKQAIGITNDSYIERVNSYATTYAKNAVDWVGQNGTNTNNMYSMISKWANGAVSANTKINGGLIETDSILAKSIAIGDFANYSQLNHATASHFGFTTTDDSGGEWFTVKNMARDIFLNDDFYDCKPGDTFRIEFSISTSMKGNSKAGGTDSNYVGSTIGLYSFSADLSQSSIYYAQRITASANATETAVSSIVTIGAANRLKFRVFLQTESYGNWSGTLKIRNVTVRKMTTGNLIVDGAITADKIATDAIKSRNYISSGGTQGSFLNLSDGSFKSPNLSWDSNGNLIAKNANLSGQINATKGTVGGWNIATNGLYSGIDENAIKIYSATTYDAQTMYQKQKIQDSFILSQKYINHFVSQQVSVGHNIPYWQTRSFIYNDSQIQLAQSDYCINTSSASNYDAQYSLKDGYISATRIYMEQNITQVGGDVINSSFSIGLDSMMGWCSIQSTKGINIYGNSSRALYVQSNDTSKYNALETEGDVVVNGKIHAVSGDNKIQLNSDNNGSIELYGNTPFIDFHSAYSSADYTCRIIANTPEQLLVCGKLRCDSNIISNNDLIANSWVYAGQNAHYTWQNQLDCYFSCGYYNNTNNVYYYAGYHAFYVNNDSGSGMMYINTNGVTSRVGFTKTSDERIKKNFESFDDNIIDAYMNIEPVKYQLKQSSNDNYHFGFKAQHVDKVFSDYGDTYNESFDICTSRPIDPDKAKELYGVDDMTEEYGLRYDELIAPTTYMVQHIYKELESTKGELAKVKQEKADLETRLQAIEAKLRL